MLLDSLIIQGVARASTISLDRIPQHPRNADASPLVEQQLHWIIALALSATNFLACCNSGRSGFVP
jgi:hypothetical protein